MKFYFRPVVGGLVGIVIMFGAGMAILAPIQDPRWFLFSLGWIIFQFGFLMPNAGRFTKWIEKDE